MSKHGLIVDGLYASITYPARESEMLPEAKGEMLIIKPWVSDDAPVEVLAYKAENATFPHDTIANQFFTESKFETYRRLGEHIATGVLGHATYVARLFASARKQQRG